MTWWDAEKEQKGKLIDVRKEENILKIGKNMASTEWSKKKKIRIIELKISWWLTDVWEALEKENFKNRQKQNNSSLKQWNPVPLN